MASTIFKALAPRRFRTKLFVTFTIFTAIISAAFTTIYTINEIKLHRQKTAEKAQLLATLLSQSIRIWLYAENIPLLEARAKETAAYAGVQRVTILNNDGRALAIAGRQSVRDEGEAIEHTIQVIPAEIGGAGDPVFGTPEAAQQSLGTIRVMMDNTELNATVRSLIWTSVVTAIVCWAIITFLAYQIVDWLTMSLEPLTSGIRTIRKGDYSYRIDTASHDELGESAVAINELAAELQCREAENKRLQKELVDSMKNEVREERRKMMAKLIQTNRMTSLGLLVSSMAHEINTPNGAIKLAGNQVAKTWKDVVPILDQVAEKEGEFSLGGNEYSLVRDEVGRAMDVIVRSSNRIDMVIKDLRAYSLGGRNDALTSVSINQVVADALAIIRAHGSRSNVQIKSDLAEELPLVQGNRFQLEQVLTNLILNGMQAIPAGKAGVLVITSGYSEENKEVFVSVDDNGEGISDEVMENLREPFFSTRMDKGGSGLGLYISDFIIQDHLGKMEIASELGIGTTVMMRIPTKQSQ